MMSEHLNNFTLLLDMPHNTGNDNVSAKKSKSDGRSRQ